MPSHRYHILTSKFFASEDKFVKVAKDHGKIVNDNGLIKFVNPYRSKKLIT